VKRTIFFIKSFSIKSFFHASFFKTSLLLFVTLFFSSAIHNKKKEVTISINPKKEIVFGQSGIFSGSFKLYGSIIKNAINVYFEKINKTGGIRGKKLRLISLDDGGSPVKAEQNISKLKKHGVTMFLGNMGTRSILKVLPQIQSKEIAMFFPWAGNDQFRNPELTNIINGPGLLQAQLEQLVTHIVDNIRHKKIAIFHADDSFSSGAAKDLKKELEKHMIKPTITASYNRYTLDITKQADKIINTDPKIVICISTSMPAVRLIDRFFEMGHYATSFFGIDSTLFAGNMLKTKGADFYYTSAVPSIKDDTKIAQEYREDIKKIMPKEVPNVLSFMYYISAAIIVDALKKIDGPITQEKIIEHIQAMQKYNLNGFTVNFNDQNRHAFGEEISIIKG